MTRSDSPQSRALPTVFIGSSSEGLEIGKYLQVDLERTGLCVVERWDQGVFQASSYTLEALAKAAQRSDFAVLIATPDDTVSSRGNSQFVARDNVIFELGLFIGAIGRERTYIVADQSEKLNLPSDLGGLTWLPYHRRDNPRSAVNEAAIGITERIRELGPRNRRAYGSAADVDQTLRSEIGYICSSARAQGWKVKTNSDLTLRLESRTGKRFTFSIDDPTRAREELRSFAASLRAHGLRVNRRVRQRPSLEASSFPRAP